MFSSKVATKTKPVTSGRLAGAGKVQTPRTKGTPKSRPKPAYSLYSTDSEEQVATLHKGLDRCAALLSDILHNDNNPGAMPKQDKAVKDGASKGRPHTPTGKKAIRRSVSKSVSTPRSAQMFRKKPTTKPPGTTPQRNTATPHSGVKLHPPQGKQNLLKSLSKTSSPQPPKKCPPRPLSALDSVPVKDQGPGEVSGEDKERSLGDVSASGGAEERRKRVQCLLGELKTLIDGQGESAQTYLSLLEQTMSSLLNTETNQNQSENHTKELQRQVMALNQQLQDKEASHQLLNSQLSILQGKLSASENELTEVQKTLQETQRRLQSKEEDNTAIKSELESTMNRLRVTLQDKFKLEATLQKKQQEIEELHKIIDSYDLSTPTPDNHQSYPPGGAKDHITQYLLSMEKNRPSLPDHNIHTTPTNTVKYDAKSIDPSLSNQGPVQGPERDGDSVVSEWTVQSESSFNTRDEAAFRDGLAALDASIASLQKTLKMDLVRT